MALVIGVWRQGQMVAAVEEWWDIVELTLSVADVASEFPLLARISPYGDSVAEPGTAWDLADECRRLAPLSNQAGSSFLLRLAGLCEQAARDPEAELRFKGD